MRSLCIVIPAYNEENRIGITLEEYGKYFEEKKKKEEIGDYKILIVLNACKDNTIGVVRNNEKKNKNIIHIEFEQGGKGFAVTEGFKFAIEKKFDLIGFVDADMATPPEAFYDLARKIGNADGIIANRWHKDSNIKIKQTPARILLSRGGNFIIHSMFLLKYQDTQCGAKLFTREMLEKVVPKLGASEWSFDIDLLFYLRREKAEIKSIPTTWEDKKDSKINLKKAPMKTLFSVMRLRLVHSPFRFIIRAHSKLPEKWKVGSIINRMK
ncbi:MAG TPA: glycosyltransferase [Patescibacteria group bacterium]|nr:glycosyltransferase [Patescibacteria group bacterium]